MQPTGFSVVTYALCKKLVAGEISNIVESLADGMSFKGAVNSLDDLPATAKTGDLYVVKDPGCKVVYYNDEWNIFDQNPQKVSELENDAGYLTADDLDELPCKMGVTFDTVTTVGRLKAGSHIDEDDSLASILYKILYGDGVSFINLYFGASDDKPTAENGLDIIEKMSKIEDQDVDILLEDGKLVKIITGNVTTEEGQFPVFACDKGAKLIKVAAWKDGTVDIIPDGYQFDTFDLGDYFLYCLKVPTYDVDLGGTTYKFTFKEI